MDEFESVYAASALDIDLCDHEKMNAEFERFARYFWDESARRADRKAREECERIALQYSQAYGQIDDAMAIARDIRATIKEDQP